MALTTQGKELILAGQLDYLNHDIRVALVSVHSGINYNNLSDIIAADTLVAQSGALTNKQLTPRTGSDADALDATADNVPFLSLTGNPIISIRLFKESTGEVFWTDSFSYTPIGVDMTLQWNGYVIYWNGGGINGLTYNDFFVQGKIGMLTAAFNFLTDDIRVALVDKNQYTWALNHTNMADVPPAAILARAAIPVAGRTITNGIFSADPYIIFPELTGSEVGTVLLYKHTSDIDDALNPLVAFYNTGTGFPYTPSGKDFGLVFSTSTTKIFGI